MQQRLLTIQNNKSIMNFIHFLNNKIANENPLSPREKIKLKQNFYGITDHLIFNKMAFAYFIDHIKQTNLDIQGSKSLTKYEWCAGSLTAEQFSTQLKAFLTSPKANDLPFWIKQSIDVYISTLDASRDQGYLIDQARSEDLSLIFFIATGWYIGISVKSNLKTIQTLAHQTLEKINHLNENEGLILLLGSAVHETRMTIKKKNEHWVVHYFNSNKKGFSSYVCERTDLLFKVSFWEKTYKFKFTPEDFTDETGQKTTVSKELKNHIHTIGKRNQLRMQKYYSAQMKTQDKNTCHFKSLWAALKKEVFYTAGIDIPTAILTWSQFKNAYGEFLLTHVELDKHIQLVAKAKQSDRAKHAEILTEIADIIAKNNYFVCVHHIVTFITRINPSNEVRSNDFSSHLKNLKRLNHCLQSHLNSYLGSLSSIEDSVKEMMNPLINFAFKKYKYTLYTKQEQALIALKNEEHIKLSDIDQIIESAKEKLSFIFPHEVKPYNYAPLEEEHLERYLDLFCSHPKFLANLKYKPTTICVLLQAIQWGKIKKLQTIYNQLDSSNIQTLEQAIIEFCKQKKEPQSFQLSLPLWCIKFDDFDLPNEPLNRFSKLFIDPLINKAKFEGSLGTYFKLIDLKFNSITFVLMGDSEFKLNAPIKCTKCDIEQLIEQIKVKQDHKNTEAIIKSSYFEDVIPELAQAIIESGWYELLDSLPLALTSELQKCNLVLTKKMTDELSKFYHFHPQSTLKNFLIRNIALNYYKTGLLKELFYIDSGDLKEIPDEYAYKFDEQTFKAGLDLLNNSCSMSIINRCLIDLIRYASTESILTELLLNALLTSFDQKNESASLISTALANSSDYFIYSRNLLAKKLFNVLWNRILVIDYNIYLQPLFRENSLTYFIFKDINEHNFEEIQQNMVSLIHKGYVFNYEELAKIVGIDNLIIQFPHAPLSLKMGIYLLKNLAKALSKKGPNLNQESKQICFNKLYKAVLENYPQYSDPEEKRKLIQEIWG